MKYISNTMRASFGWNACATLIYQSLLIAHNSMLYCNSSSQVFGSVGVAFSLMFFLSHLLNTGLSQAIAPFFSRATVSSPSFKSLIVYISVWHLMMGAAVLCTLMAVRVPASWTIITYSTLLLICSIAWLESIKKTCCALLHLAFASKIVACAELLMIGGYLVTTWGGYCLGYGKLNSTYLLLNLIPWYGVMLLIVSVGCFYTYRSYTYTGTQEGSLSFQNIFKVQLSTFLLRISRSIFSNNILTPLFALQCGMAYAGLFKFVSTITHSTLTIVRHTIGRATTALLAHSKTSEATRKQSLFTTATTVLYHALYGCIIFSVINHQKILSYSSATVHGTSSLWSLLILFVCITLSEGFFITYEQLFIIEEKAHYLLGINCVLIACAAPFLWYTQAISVLSLSVFLGIRLISFILLMYVSCHVWRITPQLSLNHQYIAGCLSLSLLFYALV